MRLRALIAATMFVATFQTAAHGADRVSDQRERVREVEQQVQQLSRRLGDLMNEMTAVSRDIEQASGSMGISQVRVREAERKAEISKRQLNERAADAYKKGTWRQAHILLGLKTYRQMLSFGQYFGTAVSADQKAYQKYREAALVLSNERRTADQQRSELLGAQQRLADLRSEIQEAITSEQQLLAKNKAELSALEAQRKKDSGRVVSPLVSARRAARQVELDRKLAALLAWYAPQSGPEPFMPPRLQGTGIVTNGLATWYGPGFDGRRASSGATYNQAQFTAASLVLPFGTLLKVTYNGKSVVVVITDRGHYVAGRVLDLSAGASQAIGHSGVKQVRMEIVTPKEPAPPFP